MEIQLAPKAACAPGVLGNRLLAALPAAERQRWLPRLEPVELSLGQVLYHPGRAPRHAYFPTTAVVSLLYMTELGESNEVAVVGCEGIVGVSLFMGGVTPTTAVVQRAGQCFRLPGHTLAEEFERSPAVMHVMLAYCLARTVQVAQSAVCSSHHSLEQQLCRRLLQALDRQQGGELTFTQEQLAGLFGVRRESVTAVALKLQKAGLVRYSRGHIHVLDRIALERHACECYAVVRKTFDRMLPRDMGASAQGLAGGPAGMCLPAPLLECSPGTTEAEANVDAGRRLVPAARKADLAELATHLQLAREQERGDLARELHDELGALLTCAKLDVASLKSRLGGASIDTDRRLQHLGEMINLGIAFSRRVVEGLHPSSLTNLGLTASLEILAREFGMNSGIRIETQLEETHLDSQRQLALYRVVQESLNNTTKYAEATDARIVLLDCGSDIVVAVRDNGKGFDPAAAGTASHGLAGMRHRIESCGGQFTVTSETGRGTLITAVLPKQAAEPAHGAALSA